MNCVLHLSLYQGECVLTVCLDEDEAHWPEQDEKGGDGGGGGETKVFYLLFSGSTQRHLTTTLQVSHVTLQAVCPGNVHMRRYTHIHTHTHRTSWSIFDFKWLPPEEFGNYLLRKSSDFKSGRSQRK